ncbi:hypothetical protein [Eggerthella sp. YY7918]|uniref:hypothetical protein n=1 Tax=Eggerthella sp. (strain YY7918) TaxID=502558 RepID=UPI0002170FE2|nr:hypothetical protein [Eggerthella sp. YY7918]BAK43930.1 methyl-accepting chemotaxis protein [Eggerthella sp. YY7918]
MKNRQTHRPHRAFRTGLIALLTVTLSIACIPSALAFSQEGVKAASASRSAGTSSAPRSTAVFEKSEVVYANLAADGAPEAVYVVNRFDVEQAGTVVDYGNYSSVQNLTNEETVTHEGDVTTFDVEKGTFFYQGDAGQKKLPWNVSLAYELNGKKVTADQLAGASGDLSIHLTTTRNTAVDPAFFDSFMMQITFTLPGDVASNVAASEGATVASAGQDTTVAFTVLPGHEGDATLTAHVNDFSMTGAQIAALPYSSVVKVPDTSDMTKGMDNLSSAVSQLTEGTTSLAAGVNELTSGARDLSSGTAAFGQGLSKLNGSSGDIVNASSQIKGALSQIATELASADFSQLDQLGQLPDALNQMADGLETLRDNAALTQQGYDQALAALDGGINSFLSNALNGDEIASLQAFVSANPAQKDTVDKLVATYEAAQELQATKPAFIGANKLLKLFAADKTEPGSLAQQAAALRDMASSLDSAAGQLDQLPQLVAGISRLSGEYSQFHDGLAQYATGLSTLSSNYAALESGTATFAQGTGQLASGANELSGGMGELNAATIKIPDEMRKQIEEMTAEFDFPEFKPVSFVSEQNENVSAVQFVMSTAAIEKPPVKEVEEPEVEPTIWERFVALFTG